MSYHTMAQKIAIVRSALEKAETAIKILQSEREQDHIEISFLRSELKKPQEGK